MAMVLYAKAAAKSAESLRKKLMAKGILSQGFPILREKGSVLFPISKNAPGLKVVELDSEPLERRPRSLRQALEGILTAEEMDSLTRSFDSLGDIAIIELPEGLHAKKHEIGGAILRVHPHFKTVLMKAGRHEGTFRTMPVEPIAGEGTTLATYTESGVSMKVSVGSVYFSPRLSAERLRIAALVKDGETVAGFFAGAGPFPLVIAHKKKCKVYAIELNPVGYNLMVENIKLNKLKGEVIPLLGDVREISQTLPKCDRVLMPLPKGGEDFLEAAFRVCKKGGTIHFYQFSPDTDLYGAATMCIKSAAAKLGRQFRVLNKKVIRHHAPHIEQIVMDFEVM